MVLALDGVLPLDLGIPTQIFNTRPNTPYELTVCGDTQHVVTTSGGFTLGLRAGLEALAEADTIIVPGYDGYRSPPSGAVTAALKLAGRAGLRIASICTGAFALAAAGLLDGRTVTTHWASADDLEELYPALSVNRGVLYIDDDTVLTSAGVTAGIDLCVCTSSAKTSALRSQTTSPANWLQPHTATADRLNTSPKAFPIPPQRPLPEPGSGPSATSTRT